MKIEKDQVISIILQEIDNEYLIALHNDCEVNPLIIELLMKIKDKVNDL